MRQGMPILVHHEAAQRPRSVVEPSWSTPTATTSSTSPPPVIEKRPSTRRCTLLGAPVTVTGFDYTNEARGLVAICEGSNGTGEVALADLAFPPDTVTAWIHAAYRHYLGLQPFPARPRPDWTWPD